MIQKMKYRSSLIKSFKDFAIGSLKVEHIFVSWINFGLNLEGNQPDQGRWR